MSDESNIRRHEAECASLFFDLAIKMMRTKLSTGSWLKLANEIEALKEQNEALQAALKSAQGALEAISGTIAIYRAHQP